MDRKSEDYGAVGLSNETELIQSDVYQTPASSPNDQSKRKLVGFRWFIGFLFFLITAISYYDRIALNLLIPEMKKELGLTTVSYGFVGWAFLIVYAFGNVGVGWLMDKHGLKLVFSIGVVVWSIAGLVTAACRSSECLVGARALLGLGESVNFPGAISAISAWFPTTERALGTSLAIAGANAASLTAPYAFLGISEHSGGGVSGWRLCFVLVGLIGLIWLPLFLVFYKHDPSKSKFVTPGELALINGSSKDAKSVGPSGGLISLLKSRSVIGLCLAKAFTVPTWNFYQSWAVLYLSTQREMQAQTYTLAVTIIYCFGDLGSIFFGWLSGKLIKHFAWTTRNSRTAVVIWCALLQPIASCFVIVQNDWVSVFLICLAVGSSQGITTCIFAMAGDAYASNDIGKVTGLANFSGYLSSAFFSNLVTGFVVEKYGYAPAAIFFGIIGLIGSAFLRVMVKESSKSFSPVVEETTPQGNATTSDAENQEATI